MRLEDLSRYDAEVEVTKATILKASEDYGAVESVVKKPADNDCGKWSENLRVSVHVQLVFTCILSANPLYNLPEDRWHMAMKWLLIPCAWVFISLSASSLLSPPSLPLPPLPTCLLSQSHTIRGGGCLIGLLFASHWLLVTLFIYLEATSTEFEELTITEQSVLIPDKTALQSWEELRKVSE